MLLTSIADLHALCFQARAEDSKDTSSGVQTFPLTVQQAGKSLGVSNGSDDALRLKMEPSPTYIHHHAAHSPEKTDIGYGDMYGDRRYSGTSQLSTGSSYLQDYPGSRRESNISQASGCSYASQGHPTMMPSDPNGVAGRRGSGDVSPAGLPLNNTLPNGYAMTQIHPNSPRQGCQYSPLIQDYSGSRRESDFSVSEFASPLPPNQPNSRRSSLNSTFSYPPDSGISFDYDSRRSSNSSVSANQVQPVQPHFPSTTKLHQPYPPAGSFGVRRPASRGRIPDPLPDMKFLGDQSLSPQQRRASEGNVVSPIYRPSDVHNIRRASDPLHHFPQSVSSRSHLRSHLTPTQPLPLPPSMQRFQQQQQPTTGYTHAPSPVPMVMDDSQAATYHAMMQGITTAPLYQGMPGLSKYSQAFCNPHPMLQQEHQEVVFEEAPMDVMHPSVHAGHAGVMPGHNGYLHCGAAPSMGIPGMMSLPGYVNEHQQWTHSATDEPLSVYT